MILFNCPIQKNMSEKWNTLNSVFQINPEGS